MIQTNYIEVTPDLIMTSMVTKETNKLIRPYLYSNISCLNLPDELVFVNTGPHVDIARKFRRDMESKFDKETSYLILTSKTWDYIWGMSAFEDVTVVSSSQTRSGIRQNLKQGIDSSYREWIIRQIPEDNKLHQSLMNNTLFIPTIGFSNKKEIGPKNCRLFLESIMASSMTIYCPSMKLLFTDSYIQSVMPPFVWSIATIETYRNWEQLDFDIIIPGRGPVVSKDYLINIRIWMENYLNLLREYRNQGVPESKILQQDFPDHPGKQRISWIDGGQYHTGIIQSMTRYWYKQILKEESEIEDLIFISE
ncbi:hypothetical protein [Candidatus Hodarchaeum mangrovi]